MCKSFLSTLNVFCASFVGGRPAKYSKNNYLIYFLSCLLLSKLASSQTRSHTVTTQSPHHAPHITTPHIPHHTPQHTLNLTTPLLTHHSPHYPQHHITTTLHSPFTLTTPLTPHHSPQPPLHYPAPRQGTVWCRRPRLSARTPQSRV